MMATVLIKQTRNSLGLGTGFGGNRVVFPQGARVEVYKLSPSTVEVWTPDHTQHLCLLRAEVDLDED